MPRKWLECHGMSPFHIREYESKTGRSLSIKPGRYKLRDLLGILEPVTNRGKGVEEED
jgi:hypothetical protein